MESVEFKCFQVPMEIRVDYLKDNHEEKHELFLFIQTNGGTERGGIGRQRFVKSRKHPGEGSLFMGMVFPAYNGWLLDTINHRAINKKSYRAYEEGRIVVGAPISGVTMPTPSNVQAADHLLHPFLATLDVTPTSAAHVRASATVDRAPARVDRAPEPVDRAPEPVDRASASVDRAPARVDRAPARVDRAPEPVDRAPEPVDRASAPVDRTPARVDRAPAPVINVYPRVVVKLDSENIFRCLNLGRGRTLHRSAIELRKHDADPVQTPAPAPEDYVDVAEEL